MRGDRAVLAAVLAATAVLVGCDDGIDVTRPAQEVSGASVEEVAEFCDVLTSQDSLDPTSRDGAADATDFLDELLEVTPDGFRDDVAALRDVAEAITRARSDDEAARIARDRFQANPGLITSVTKLDRFRTDNCA